MIEPDELDTGRNLSVPFFRVPNLYNIIDRETLERIIEYTGSMDFYRIQKSAVMDLRAASKFPNDPDKLQIPNTDYSITFEGYGVYSLVFSFQTNNKKLSIRVRNNYDGAGNPNQTQYMSEFLKFSKLKEDPEVNTVLSRYGIDFPELYMATTEVEIREFIDGDILPEDEAHKIVPLILPVLNDFLEKKRKEDPVRWGSVNVDITDKLGRPAGKNFIVSSVDRKIYLIDPFAG